MENLEEMHLCKWILPFLWAAQRNSRAGWTFRQRQPTTSDLQTFLVCPGLVHPCFEVGSAQSTEPAAYCESDVCNLSCFEFLHLQMCNHHVCAQFDTYRVIWRQWLCPSRSRPIVAWRLSANPCKPKPSELCSTSCSNSANMESKVGSSFIIQRSASGKMICLKLVFSSYSNQRRQKFL